MDKLQDIAERNLRHYLSKASFASGADRLAAQNCVDVLAAQSAELAALREALVTIRDSTFRNATTLRGMADRALANAKETK